MPSKAIIDRARIGGLISAFLLSSSLAQAYEPDAPFIDAQKQHNKEWSKEDKDLDNRLAAMEKKYGKKPNIIYVLADDIGWGELGSYGGGILRGTPTPNLDTMAQEGMKFMSHYSEPSCTPTRLALLTGRYPVRTGVDIVLWPGQTQGLADEEVTVAEMLSKAGGTCTGTAGLRLCLLWAV
jgi:arylsulfatase